MSVDRACLVHLSRRTALVALLVIVVSIEGQAQLPAISRNDAQTYDDLLKLYRSGAIERSVGVLDEWLARADGQREAHRWIGEALRANRRDDLEAAFLLYSDALMAAWRQDEPYPEQRVERYTTAVPAFANHARQDEPEITVSQDLVSAVGVVSAWAHQSSAAEGARLPRRSTGRVSKRCANPARRRLAAGVELVDVARELAARSRATAAPDHQASDRRARLFAPGPVRPIPENPRRGSASLTFCSSSTT